MNFYLAEVGYIFNETTKIWSRQGYTGIVYSDGDEVEQRIASIIDKATDLSVLSTELRQHCTDWPSLYHLSGTRANILRPFEDELRGDILEIGAGCGAITRYLGECGGNILALEGSPRRAAIARARTHDLQNVTVVSDRFDLFSADRKFDAITLIGVLEYANLFTVGESPALNMLERVRALLKPEGKLFIAIENQLGLKYFAGAPEDHLGQSMYGIEGRYRKDQPQTFGRKILTNLLKQAGFANCDFLAPFPDYKLPVSIVTEHGFEAKKFDAGALAWQSVRRDPQLPPILAFSPELVWPTLAQNGLALDLANSFLIVASRSKEPNLESSALAWHFTTERIREFCKTTHFVETEAKIIEVQYKSLSPTLLKLGESKLLEFGIPDRVSYTYGVPFSVEFIRIVTCNGWHMEMVCSFLKKYLDILEKTVGAKQQIIKPLGLNTELPGEFFDYIPQNIIISDDNNVCIIDEEWKSNKPITAGFLVFRALIGLLSLITKLGEPVKGFGSTYFDFIRIAMNHLNWLIGDDEITFYANLEATIQSYVSGRTIDSQDIQRWLNKPIQTTNLYQAVTKYDEQIAKLNQILTENDRQITSLNRAMAEVRQQEKFITEVKMELQGVLASKSWRVTRPLRGARRIADRWIVSLCKHPAINALRIARRQLRTHGTIGFLRRIPYYLRQLCYRPDLLWRTVPAHAPEFLPGSDMRHEVRMHPELRPHTGLHQVAKVSVVIPTLNAGPEFPWLLQKLFAQQDIGNIEIVIVDSGSKDETVTIAKEAGCVVVEILPTEFSHSYARNRGADEATGDYLLFMVQDAYPIGSYWMVGILQFLQDYAHDKLVAASCAEYSRSDSDVMYDSMIHTHYQFLGCLHYDRIGEFKEQGHASLRSQGQLSDVSCMIERSVFQRYRYRGDYAEDLDLGTRLIQDGYRVAMLASIKVIHSHNRPVYYYFKRSFVDVIFLVNLFPDFEYAHIKSQDGLFAGILSTATLLTRWLQTPLPPERTDTRDILRRFNDECRRQFAPTNINEAAHLDNAHLDDWLEQFRQRQEKAGLLQRKLDVSELQEARRFLDAFLGRVDHFSRFVEQIYGPCTDSLSIELRQAIVKIYGAAAGSALAFMFLDITHQRCQGDLAHAQAIYEELKAGI